MTNNTGPAPSGANSPAGGRGMAVVLMINLVIAVVGGLVVLIQYRSVRSLQSDRFERTRDEYREMVQIQAKLYEHWKKFPRENIYDIPTNPGDLFSFIKEAHVRSGIEEGLRDRLSPSARKIQEGTEHSYLVSFRSSADRKLKRDQIARFLIEIERGRPFLKTQSVRVGFSPQSLDEITVADIVLAYIVPEAKK